MNRTHRSLLTGACSILLCNVLACQNQTPGALQPMTSSNVSKGSTPLVQTRYRTIKIDDMEIFYREAGPEDAPTVLLLHGFPSSSHMFRELLLRLGDDFHLVAPDYPGFGNSSIPEASATSFDLLATTMEHFTEQLGLGSYSLYLMDFGAPVGFRLATAHPERVEALIIQNGNAYAEGIAHEFWDPLRAYWAEHSKQTEEPILGFFAYDTTRFQYTAGTRNPEGLNPDNWKLAQFETEQPGSQAARLALSYDYRTNVELYPSWQNYLRTQQPPTLVVWGANDPIFPPTGAEPLKHDLETIEFHLLDTGHFALEEDGEFIADTMRSFLNKYVLAASQDHP